MIDKQNLLHFVSPFYVNKDVMHDLSHIERMIKSANKLLKLYPEVTDRELIEYGCYFHGFIYSEELKIREYLQNAGLNKDYIEKIIQISWGSQKDEVPASLEGKLLHDAHRIEGGKTYLVVKSLCTGTARGQSLEETLLYLEKYVLGKGECYLPEAKRVYQEMQQFANEFVGDLRKGIDEE